MFAILKNEKDKDARTEYLIEAKRMNISLKLPHINESDIDFKIEGKGIRFGLSSIKWISDGVASKIMANRPFNSYQEVRDIAFKKGSGINSRAVEALDAIGALTFPDHPRNEDTVRDNLYEYLNLPEFSMNIPSHYYAYIDNTEDYDESKSHIVMGMAKKIKRGKGWCRVEFMDKTGMVGIFDEEDSKIEVGKTYIILSASNRIADFLQVEDADKVKSPLTKFLNYKTLPYGQNEYFVLSFNPRVTKAGKRMAHMVLADYDRNLIPVVVFPTMFAEAYMKCEPGSIQKLIMNELKDGTITVKEISK
jgi:DNA polymerase III alpha subunit